MCACQHLLLSRCSFNTASRMAVFNLADHSIGKSVCETRKFRQGHSFCCCDKSHFPESGNSGMSLQGDFPLHYPSAKRNLLKRLAKPAVLKFQRYFRLFPQEICLISGAPRSGTTALFAWLNDQPAVAAYTESRILVGIHRFMEQVYRFRDLKSHSTTLIKLARSLVFDYYASSSVLIGKRLLLDKEPLEPIAFPSKDYEAFIVNMKRLFPEIKLLLVIRDPIATIWSMSRRSWGESLTNAEAQEFTIDEYAENWSSCANLILRYRSDPNTYIVRFEQLVDDSTNESKRILHFLNLNGGKPFSPSPTKETGFSHEDRERILRLVKPQLERLSAQGISVDKK